MELIGFKDENQFYEVQMKHYVQEVDKAKVDAQLSSEEAIRNYIANFHLTEEYQCFGTYWMRFFYIDVVDKVYSFIRNLKLLN